MPSELDEVTERVKHLTGETEGKGRYGKEHP